MSSSPLRCTECGKVLDLDDAFCRSCGTAVEGHRQNWPAPSPSAAANDPTSDVIPLVIVPASSNRRHIIALALAAVLTLVSGLLWIFAEIMIRDGQDRTLWNAVWIVSAVVTVAAVIRWIVVGNKWVRRWRRQHT